VRATLPQERDVGENLVLQRFGQTVEPRHELIVELDIPTHRASPFRNGNIFHPRNTVNISVAAPAITLDLANPGRIIHACIVGPDVV
jgi:hypothetical protein